MHEKNQNYVIYSNKLLMEVTVCSNVSNMRDRVRGCAYGSDVGGENGKEEVSLPCNVEQEKSSNI